jgi:hypothetical protein
MKFNIRSLAFFVFAFAITMSQGISRNVHQAVWLSLDGLYTYGGKVKTDGFGGSDSQSSFGMGGTVGLALSKQISGKLTYGGTVSHNESGGDGHFWRIVGNYAF